MPGPSVTLDSGIHFRKASPITESHVLVHANDGTMNSGVFDNTTAVPNTGSFTFPALFTDTVFSTAAHFSNAPDSSVVMTNGTDLVVWSGTEARCPSFLIGASSVPSPSVIMYDYTSEVNNEDPGIAATLYKAADNKVYVYIGAIRPLQGVKFYVANVNTSAATVTVKYWNGTAWTSVTTLVDNTVAVTGKSLSGTGTMTFDSTVTTAKVAIINNEVLFFYQFVWTGLDANAVTVSACTTDMPVQSIVDIWDGTKRPVLSILVPNIGVVEPQIDDTINAATRNFVPGDQTTVIEMDGFSSAGGSYMALGFMERMMGLNFQIPSANVNAANLTISYWNGQAWVAVSSQVDNTKVGTITFNKSGWVTWTPPASGIEQKRSYSGGADYYYYKFTNSAGFSSLVNFDVVFGLPVPGTIGTYKFPATWQNRTVLVGDISGHKNSLLISAYGSICVFNGSDSIKITDIGDSSPPTAVGALFTRYTGQFFDTLIICKDKETWVLDGTSVTNYHLYKISDKYGCIAPETFRIVPVSFEIATGISRHVAIWLSATGIVLFDGNTISEIDQDVKNYFQLEKTECIYATSANKSTAFVDEREREYHIIIPSGAAALNTELVYSTKRKAWYKIDRGAIVLQSGFTAYSTVGVPYTYAGTATGFLERLEDPASTTFDSNTITRTIQTRDIPFAGWVMQTAVRYVKLITRSMTGTVTAIISHFGDGATTADVATVTANPVSTTTTFAQNKGSLDWGNKTFHSFKIVNATYTSGTLFEPVALTGLYQDVGIDRRST